MEPTFMEMVDHLREVYGAPLAVTSAYRCPQHPIEAKKTSDRLGAHTFGRAIDLAVSGADAYKLLKLAQEIGFMGIGCAQKGAISSRFIHVDNLSAADKFPRPWLWSY